MSYHFDSAEEKKKYWDGPLNYCMRLFYYVLQGCGIYNDVRNYVILVVLAYLAVKVDNYGILFMMFSLATPLTAWIGHFKIHRMAKNHEWLNIHFATHYGKRSIDLQEETLKINQETLKAITKLNERLENGHRVL